MVESPELLRYLFHHVFLPPKLPQEDDYTPDLEGGLLDVVLGSLREFKSTLNAEGADIVRVIYTLVNRSRQIQIENGEGEGFGLGVVSESGLKASLQKLTKNEFITIHIKEQNAGLILHHAGEAIHFEAFELSADNASVMQKGRLRRSFPACSIAISVDTYNDNDFQKMFAQAVATMSAQPVTEMQPQIRKAGLNLPDLRDTSKPHVVTEYLMNILHALGEPVKPLKVWKNIREDVVWEAAVLPWRRSPMWLLLRITMHLVFEKLTPDPLKSLYKPYMAYLHSYVLEKARKGKLESDILYSMSAKLSQRLIKISHMSDEGWYKKAQEYMTSASLVMKLRWKEIMSESEPNLPLESLETIRRTEDISHCFPEMDLFIETLENLPDYQRDFVFSSTEVLPVLKSTKMPCFPLDTGSLDLIYGLTAFESWTECYLDSWSTEHSNESDFCQSLSKTIEKYYYVAKERYSENPEAYSIMVLTVMELWVCCDKSACRKFDILQNYNHEIDHTAFTSLLLPTKAQMKRLLDVEVYLQSRKSRATELPSVFRDFGTSDSFAVSYFSRSNEHQALKKEIEIKAEKEKIDKINELSELNGRYEELMRLYNSSNCEYYKYCVDYDDQIYEQRHSSSCQKCSYINSAKELRISIHEWPLSRKTNVANATVFELRVPPEYSAWREITHLMVKDVLQYDYSSIDKAKIHCELLSDRGLYAYFISDSNSRRVGLCSAVSPHIKTNRNIQIIPTNRDSVCLDNAIQYQYWNQQVGVANSSFSPSEKLHRSCSYSLPKASKNLERFISRKPKMSDGLSPNQVLASQHLYPEHMSLAEYRAFTVLPLGCTIQWHNILIQLAMPEIDFTKLETSTLIRQVIHQVGPSSGGVERLSHGVLLDVKFATRFLQQLEKAKSRVGENWESSRAIEILIYLATKLLTLSKCTKIQGKCLQFLEGCRSLAASWLDLVSGKMQSSTNEDQRKALSSQVIEISLVCVGSFDVEKHHLSKILKNRAAATYFALCSIKIRECLVTTNNQYNSFDKATLERWRKLTYRAYPLLLRQLFERKNFFIDQAIAKYWVSYTPTHKWRKIPDHEHWLESETAGDIPLPVHFNLITAELLVNGAPLARLPKHYEQNHMYSILFKDSPLQVMPSTKVGYEFSTRSAYLGYALHFGILPGSTKQSDFILCACKDGKRMSLIPSTVLQEYLPTALVSEYIHWYYHETKEIRFSPKHLPWSIESGQWCIKKFSVAWLVERQNKYLINIKRPMAQKLSRIFDCIEDALHIHILCSLKSKELDIELPRLRIGFYQQLPSLSLCSRQFRDMFVDYNQSIGTLVGLKSKLVLKAKSNVDRLVLIPEGQVGYNSTSRHIKVEVAKGTCFRMHNYRIDILLGRFIDNDTIQSKLYVAYLHALTSYCLPDPLTKLTGTEKALSILQSAAILSIPILKQENIDVLERISQLKSERKFYPDHLKVMQTVRWDSNLSFLSQDSQLYVNVHKIFQFAQKTKIFHPEAGHNLPQTTIEHLLTRDLIRSSTFRVAEFGAENYTTEYDDIYDSRDCGQHSDRGKSSYVIARLLFEKSGSILDAKPFVSQEALWNSLRNSNDIHGPNVSIPPEVFIYDGNLFAETLPVLSTYWCATHVALSKNSIVKFQVIMWLSAIAFSEKADMKLVFTMAYFYCIPELAQISPPDYSIYHISKGDQIPSIEQDLMNNSCDFAKSSESSLPKHPGETTREARDRRWNLFNSRKAINIHEFFNNLKEQWPCQQPSTPVGYEFRDYIKVDDAMLSIRGDWDIHFRNHTFHLYLDQVQNVISRQAVEPVAVGQFDWAAVDRGTYLSKRYISANDVFSASCSMLPSNAPKDVEISIKRGNRPQCSTQKLQNFIKILRTKVSGEYQEEYVSNLEDSLSHLNQDSKEDTVLSADDEIQLALEFYHQHCADHVRCVFDRIKTSHVSQHGVFCESQHAPRVSPLFYLQRLSHNHWKLIPKSWKPILIQYALALTSQQRSERLLNTSNKVDFKMELLNIGHEKWDPLEYPEWLLLEIESKIIIRPVQINIAFQMIAPQTGSNAVLQLNMGEGKSSTIVPIVCASLADGKKLVRTIVARPQSQQMLQMMISKLGGLLNRRIYHLPISRSLNLDITAVQEIQSLCEDCQRVGGILFVLPEHLMSFKLMGIEHSIGANQNLAKSLLSTQLFFDNNSRDVIDESDENFSVKFELIYTMGLQQSIELGSNRWTVVQHILDLVNQFAPEVSKELGSRVIEINEKWRGRFRRIRILQQAGRDALDKKLGDHIDEFGLPGFSIAFLPPSLRRAVLSYVIHPNPAFADIEEVKFAIENRSLSDSMQGTLLLARGLIAGGVLYFCLGLKRWRVNYGLDFSRNPPTKLAVPYRAKDSPTLRSEFSHPDVVIVLTNLCYYYDGLENEDLNITFQHLLNSDKANDEYRLWVITAPDLPTTFHQLSGINFKDRLQCENDVFPYLRYSKGAIDYFLAYLIFPRMMKEFPHKISSSGWDLGAKKSHVTTGFSGTNDSCNLLPLDVKHLDLESQKHTNSLVLNYILQDENSITLLASENTVDCSQDSDAVLLLRHVFDLKPVVRVILDVGAQILELKNEQVASTWLKMWHNDDSTKAAIFFNDYDELMVIDRRGAVEPLQVSPYINEMESCLVFLDESHTRGTDLKLPLNYRAAVTLGANITKDRLVQACMRMRKLGQGQSVVFCIAEEIQLKIMEFTDKKKPCFLEVADVLMWVISETFTDLRRSLPIWATQGHRFINQRKVWRMVEEDDGMQKLIEKAPSLLEQEAQTLEYRYSPTAEHMMQRALDDSSSDLAKIWQRCEKFGIKDFGISALQEEQERELSPEKESERQMEKPPEAKAHTHSIHPDLSKFISTGVLNRKSPAFIPAFQTLRDSTAGDCFDSTTLPQDLLVTVDFSKTVEKRTGGFMSDVYQRPVQWIITSLRDGANMIILSPYEARHLRQGIINHKKVTLHIYSPRCNIEFDSLDTLDLFTEGASFENSSVPRNLIIQLNLFAGQLYFNSYDEYTEFCMLLHLAWKTQSDDTITVQSDGFIPHAEMRTSPVKFLRILMSNIRRNCQAIDKTHVGKVLEGQILETSKF